MRTRMVVAAILYSCLAAAVALANGPVGAAQPPAQDAPQSEAGAVSQQQIETVKKREEAKKRRDELMQKRQEAAGQQNGIQSLDQQK